MTLWPRIAISPGPSPSIVFQSPSTSFISTPQIGVPIVPGLVGRPSWLKLATGEVSDRP